MTTLSHVQRTLLTAVLLDGKSILLPLVGRKRFDQFFQFVREQNREWHYAQWKETNKNLILGGPIPIPLLTQLSGLPYFTTDPRIIRWLRQVFGLFTRLEEGTLDVSPHITAWKERVAHVRAGFPQGDPVLHYARILVARWLGQVPSIYALRPKHGPGAVSTGERGWEKSRFTATYTQLDQQCLRENSLNFLGSSILFHLNLRHMAEKPHILATHKHPFTKVIAVPKDMTKPRIISAEPLSLQFLQQGMMRVLVQRLENCGAGMHFTDQRPNQLAARDLSNATLDMSNASDLVSRRIVHQLLPAGWRELLFSLRSHFALDPEGNKIPLRCFAPMGSAICFPVEALVFASIAHAYLISQGARSWELKSIHVFGDDIIVPLQYAGGLIAYLRDLGMEPNVSKCCHAFSFFRESCGAEWYCGEDVTVLRPKSLRDSNVNRFDRVGVLPMVGHANRALSIGYSKLAQALADLVTLPVAIGDGDGFASPFLKWQCVGRYRWNERYQRLEQRSAASIMQTEDLVPEDRNWEALHMHLCAGWASRTKFDGRTKLGYVWCPTRWCSANFDEFLRRLSPHSKEIALRSLSLQGDGQA